MAQSAANLASISSKEVNGSAALNGGGIRSSASSPVSYTTQRSGLSSFRKSANGGVSSSLAGDSTITNLLANTANTLEKRSTAELGYGVVESISNTSFVQLVEFIGQERLSSLPHKGSKWDKVLMRALYFAEQQHGFEKMVRSFGTEDISAVALGYGYAKLLLKLGHENASALDKAFGILYKHSLEVSGLLHRSELLQTTPQIREQLCLMYSDLLTLTSAVATRYYKAVYGMATTKVSLDIQDICGSVLDSFRERQAKVAELIWARQAQLEGFDLEHNVTPKDLNRWLTPTDRVLSTLSSDHMALLGNQAEFTCIWFQKPLISFAQGSGKIMAVTGPAGSGKSVLAASIAERLQRRLGRQTVSSLFYSIKSTTPSSATPVSVLKSLLAQIFALRIGNMQTYHAIARAYEQCLSATTEKDFEGHLWAALEDALKKPLENARDLILVVDGIDELQGGEKAGQAFFERLSDAVSEGKRTKLIGLGEKLSVPSGTNATRVEMNVDVLHDDLHAVVLRNLVHTTAFTSKQGPDQEQVLERLVRASRGSFIWATLTSQLLRDIKSADEFNKTVESFDSQKPSIQDLVQRTLSKSELPATTRTILGWILAAERPLTTYEIRTLLSAAPQNAPTPDQHIDIHAALHALEPVLLFNDEIVRFKHPSIQSTVSTLVESSKVSVPETRHSDLLIRLLNYVRTTLREEPDPSFDEYDVTALERHFHESPLLLYVIQYWVLHLRYLGNKVPQDFAKVLPTTTILPQMERTFWSLELPLSQALELHKTAYTIRQSTLPELSGATLQSILNTAVIYDILGRPQDAASLYFTCTKISRNLLSNYHPLPIECGQRYLSVTETSVTTSRTEVMTHREETLKILITLFERQYSKQSAEVIAIRTQLAQLYEHISEQSKAMEVWQTVRSDTMHVYGQNSSQARDISSQYNVSLAKAKPDDKIEVRADSIFDEEEEEHIDEHLDVTTVHRQIAAAKDERTFVELWQKISAIARNTTQSEWHERNIDVSMAYAKYLQQNKRTEEASAIASSVAREYESNQASYSEGVVSKLSGTASFMREIGQYTASLAILKRVSNFFQSTRREDSSAYQETQRQITTVMGEVVSRDTSATQGPLLEDIYRQNIQDSSKVVDAKLLGVGKTLISQYMDESNPTVAIELLRLTLHRIWPAFLVRSSYDVDLPTNFTKESLDFVDQLIECYTRQRQFEQVETTLTKLFHALLSAKSPDFTQIRKIQTRLIKYYDDNNYPEKSVTVLQKILPALRTHMGPTNPETIKTLYELGSRSRTRARTYPFWIDYYQQIVNVLNKDQNISAPEAMDALIIVATSYWEDRRYPEAVNMFTILWNTFLQKPKEYKQFSQPEFVEQLYERYYASLEQTGARFDRLYQISTEYRKTCITIFGAESAVTAKATLSLARIAKSSEAHQNEAMGWYEEASRSAGGNTQSKSEIKDALRTLYTRTITTTSGSSSTSMKSEQIQSAVSQISESYNSYVSKYGYSHASSLSQLKELAVLYKQQGKSETASRELTTASREIMTKETSSARMIEAAETIVAGFVASGTVSHAESLVTELRRQVISKDASTSKSWGFDLTKYGRSVLPFLAAMEFRLHPNKYTSFSQLMSELSLEMWYYEDYRKLVQSNANLQAIIIAASTLRRFLVNAKRTETVQQLDNEVGHIFVTRDGSRLKLKSQHSGRIFMVAIMKYLGTYKTSSFAKAVILASNDSMEELMKTEQYPEAYDIAGCAFAFAVDYQGYNGSKGISHGFNLASLLAGIDFPKKCPDATLRKQMLHLATEIVKKVLEICKKQDIDFAGVQLREINRLVVLLGELEDYETLEWLLTILWHSRSAQSTWSANTLHNLGRLLICARYLGGHPIQALRLCEDVAYNLRRTRGASHPATTDMNLLLAQLYTSSGQYYLAQSGGKDKNAQDLAQSYFAKALAVHEDMLRLLVNDATDGGIPGIDDDEDLDTTGAILAEHGVVLETAGSRIESDATARLKEEGSMANTHAKLLKLAYQRLGAWPKDKPAGEYEKLVGSAISTFSEQMKDVQSVDKWQVKGFGGGKAESGEGSFGKVTSWNLVEA